MKKLKLLTLVLTLFMVSVTFAQTTPIKKIQRPGDPAVRKIKELNQPVKPLYKKPTTAEVMQSVYKIDRTTTTVKTMALNNENNTMNETRIGAEKQIGDCVMANYKMDVTASSIDFISLGSVDDGWLMPGTVMDTKSFLNGSYNSVSVNIPRVPIRIFTNAHIKSGKKVYEDVANPASQGEVQQAIENLNDRIDSPDRADVVFTAKEINSEEDLVVKVSGFYNNSIAGIKSKANLSIDKNKKKSYLMLDYIETYYKINSDIINSQNLFQNDNNNIDLSKLTYIKSVSYGRRALLILESESSMEDMKAAFSISVDGIINDAGFKADYSFKKIREKSSAKIILYGGSAKEATNAVSVPMDQLENGFRQYIKNSMQSSINAVPISYTLRYITNPSICAINSTYNYEKSNCQTSIPPERYKLKVTLTDIQNINGRDGSDNPDDYGIQQSIVYFSKGKEMVTTKENADYNKFPNMINKCTQVPNNKNQLICGDNNNQIQVRQNTNVSERNRSQIGNSIIFSLPVEYYEDEAPSFKIHTWLKEYTSGEDKVLTGSTKISVVNIKDVMSALTGDPLLDKDKNLSDKSIDVTEDNKTIMFDSFGNGVLMADIQEKKGKIILDYPIIVGEIGAKAVVWMSFELVK